MYIVSKIRTELKFDSIETLHESCMYSYFTVALCGHWYSISIIVIDHDFNLNSV